MVRPLPRLPRDGAASLARGRELARSAADSATDVLHPLITLARGLRRLAGAGRRKWEGTPRDGRGGLLFLAASVVLVVALVPYGPPLAVVTLMAAAAWYGRERTPAGPAEPDPAHVRRLGSLYEALVPYFSVPEDPAPLYAHGGDWEEAFGGSAFDGEGRISRLLVRYPAYFTDGEAASRARIEGVLHAKSGRGREYRFDWDEERNELTVTALAPLPTDIAAQRFVTSPGELVLGFTDPTGVRRTLPVTGGSGDARDEPPVVWRTGPRSTEPHLLAVGRPGDGTTTLLRSLALQVLPHGDVLVVEGTGTGEYACLAGRRGVLGVECGPVGALAGLEWASGETKRRLIAVNEARGAGRVPDAEVRRPLYVLVDRPSVLGHLTADGGRDPRALLQVPLRHGRAAGVTVVVAEQYDALDTLSDTVLQYTRARVALGPVGEGTARVLGAAPLTTPVKAVPPGRGHARLGDGPVLRLQVPAAPDPYDDATPEALRRAVLALLPTALGEADEAAEAAGATRARETARTDEATGADRTAAGTEAGGDADTATETDTAPGESAGTGRDTESLDLSELHGAPAGQQARRPRPETVAAEG
ncbi:hypothetical protein JNUCC64_29750 [Streptomyces sp. JNUCC 64]